MLFYRAATQEPAVPDVVTNIGLVNEDKIKNETRKKSKGKRRKSKNSSDPDQVIQDCTKANHEDICTDLEGQNIKVAELVPQSNEGSIENLLTP